jgi:hypothetical protein
MNAAVTSSGDLPPSTVSRKRATIGYERLANWFQSPVSVTARADGAEQAV